MLLICHNNQKDSIKKNCEGLFLEGGPRISRRVRMGGMIQRGWRSRILRAALEEENHAAKGSVRFMISISPICVSIGLKNLNISKSESNCGNLDFTGFG